MRIKLNQEFVRTAKAKDGAERTLYWDRTMPGFGLMVTDAGDHGHDPLKEKRKKQEAARNSLRSIVEEYQRREGGRLRTAEWRMAALERHVLPTLGGKHIEEIKRSDIVRLLDNLEDRGPVMADKVLGILSRS